jgi:hypothetical protein
MAATPNDIQGLPEGAVLKPIASQPAVDPSQIQGLPAGAELRPIAGAPEAPPDTSSTLSKVGDFAKGIGEGAVSSMGETIQSLPWVGKRILSPEAMSAEREYFRPGSAAEKHGQTTGDIAEPVLEFVMGDEALKGLAIADKIGIAGKIAKIAQDSPYIGKILQHGVNAARTGTVGTTEALAKGATLPEALKTGAGVAVGGEALSAAADAVAAPAGSTEGLMTRLTNPFRKLIQTQTASPAAAGEAVSQPIAQAGVKATAPTVGASLRSGIDVETPLAAAKKLYQTVDDAAKTDFKVLYDKMDAAQDAARIAAPGSPEEAVAQRNIKATQDSIDEHKAIAARSGVPNVDKTLAQADAKFAETQANKDFNSKFFGSQGVISGNVAHSVPEKIDVDAAIKTLENFDKPNKFGISRMQQTSLGKDGAFKLKQVLYDAQKAGQTAMDSRALRNTVLKLVGIGGGVATTAAGAAYELTK